MTDRDGLCKKLRDCPPEYLKGFVDRNYKRRLAAGGWVSPLNVESLDKEVIREYLKETNMTDLPTEQSPATMYNPNPKLDSKPPRPADFLPESITAEGKIPENYSDPPLPE
tara:strand:- start:389 stop:721 length:333 start_codon:yes stop_codon:yes gene_type:complete